MTELAYRFHFYSYIAIPTKAFAIYQLSIIWALWPQLVPVNTSVVHGTYIQYIGINTRVLHSTYTSEKVTVCRKHFFWYYVLYYGSVALLSYNTLKWIAILGLSFFRGAGGPGNPCYRVQSHLVNFALHFQK